MVALAAVSSMALLPMVASAQSYSYGGALLNHDIMMSTEIASLSQNQMFGTARSMAMGGAFTSLGADISTVSQNPAGLGMFMQEVFSITPTLAITDATTDGLPSWVGNNRSTFGFSNMGATFQLSENASGSLIAVNAAITYNKLADYNSKMSFSSDPVYDPDQQFGPSIVNVYIKQLIDINYDPDKDTLGPYYWPALGGYETWMVDPTSDGSWTTNAVANNAFIIRSYDMTQRGSAGEYAFALGANVGNYLYLGATFGIQQITRRTDYTYQEEYLYEDGVANISDPADYSLLWQQVKLDGVGTNLKLGMIIRPVRAVRIGVAFHTPTYYTLNRSYETSSESKFGDKNSPYISDTQLIVDNYEYSWRFRTPSKLLLGGSIQIGNMGIVSLDYERQWYNWTRVSSTPGEITTYQYQIDYEDNYKPTNTLRAGIEVKPTPIVALRAGAGYSSSMLKDESQVYTPVATSNHYISCGVGVQLSANTTLDVAYQNYHQNYSSYELFYVADETGGVVSNSDLYNTSFDRNYVVATLTFKL